MVTPGYSGCYGQCRRPNYQLAAAVYILFQARGTRAGAAIKLNI